MEYDKLGKRMNVCKITVSDNLKRVKSRKELEKDYWSKLSSDEEIFKARAYVRQLCIEHLVRISHLPPKGWDKETYSFTVCFESKNDLKEFIDKFYNYELFKDLRLKIIDQGFSISEPIFQ